MTSDGVKLSADRVQRNKKYVDTVRVRELLHTLWVRSHAAAVKLQQMVAPSEIGERPSDRSSSGRSSAGEDTQ